MAANDLTTLALVKAYLPESTTNVDALLASLITAVSQMVETYCDDPFMSASYSYTTSGWNSCIMSLPYGPITAVSSVTIGNQAIPAKTGSGNGFTWSADKQSVQLSGFRFWRGNENVTIVYTAGFADVAAVPMDLQLAVWKLVALRLKERNRIGKTSESIGGKQTVSVSSDAMPADVRETLERYRRRGI